MSKNKGKKNIVIIDKNQYNMKVVTVDTCITCKSQCRRGLAYIEKMKKPGAIGKGVPCVLTKGKAYK
ncbi:hypothetical protein [Bacillus alkalicellulosilyticus]|uniref:hypothetical protein n=1 Tax=Alkalihalobacterium alkalicellulosilyticum TaxID=1912214 RepID=UPI0009967CE2|nr:hypothetical protein [Bacillus alkalicellulosilyticus]